MTGGNWDLPVTEADFDELADRVALNARMAKVRALIARNEAARFERAVMADIDALPVVGDAA